MKFEFEHALRDLDRKTLEYFQLEIFHHGSTKVKEQAVQALHDLQRRQSTRKLARMLQIAP